MISNFSWTYISSGILNLLIMSCYARCQEKAHKEVASVAMYPFMHQINIFNHDNVKLRCGKRSTVCKYTVVSRDLWMFKRVRCGIRFQEIQYECIKLINMITLYTCCTIHRVFNFNVINERII